MTLSFLKVLPDVLLMELLSLWCDLKMIVHLDTSFCNKSGRHSLLSLFLNDNLHVSGSVRNYAEIKTPALSEQFCYWICWRRIKLREIHLSSPRNSEGIWSRLNEMMSSCCTELRTLDFSIPSGFPLHYQERINSCLFSLVQQNKKLAILKFTSVSSERIFADISLLRFVYLREIRFSNCFEVVPTSSILQFYETNPQIRKMFISGSLNNTFQSIKLQSSDCDVRIVSFKTMDADSLMILFTVFCDLKLIYLLNFNPKTGHLLFETIIKMSCNLETLKLMHCSNVCSFDSLFSLLTFCKHLKTVFLKLSSQLSETEISFLMSAFCDLNLAISQKDDNNLV